MLIHGLLGSSRSWTPLIEHLSPTHRVLAPDLFGHGASAKPIGDYSLGAALERTLSRIGWHHVAEPERFAETLTHFIAV